MRLEMDALCRAVTGFLQSLGVRADDARAVATVLVEAEADGLGGHGLSRLPIYAEQLRAGGLTAQPPGRVEWTRPGIAVLCAGGGLGPPAALHAVELVAPRAREQGLAVVVVREAGHVGPLSAYVGRLAQQGLLGYAVANTPPAIAPWGGRNSLLGTNPIAFAAPAQPDDLVIDLSLTVAARGKILVAAGRNEPIPEGWAVTADGEPTTEAGAALAGSLLPAGGAKGYALALMVEVFAGILAGPFLSHELRLPWEEPESKTMPGFFLLALDPQAFGPGFAERMCLLAEAIRQGGGRFPGERRAARRRQAEREGIEVSETLVAQLRHMGLELSPQDRDA